jgi:hypothetical protein
MFLVPFVLFVAGDVHVTSVPIAVLRLALRTPMRPNAELRVAKPVGTPVLLERFPRRLEFTGMDRFVFGWDDD